MDYMEILGHCIHKIEKAKATDGDSYDPADYHWEIGYSAMNELLRGFGVEHMGPMDELYGVRMLVLPVESYVVMLFKEVK